MAKPLGPNFGRECILANLGGLPFVWLPDGTITGREKLTAAQNTTLDNVIAAHDSSLSLVPGEVSDRQWFQQMANEGNISQAAAIDATSNGKVPQPMASYIATLPAADQFPAKMLFGGAVIVKRDSKYITGYTTSTNFPPPVFQSRASYPSADT